jgi:hypothetical protein
VGQPGARAWAGGSGPADDGSAAGADEDDVMAPRPAGGGAGAAGGSGPAGAALLVAVGSVVARYGAVVVSGALLASGGVEAGAAAGALSGGAVVDVRAVLARRTAELCVGLGAGSVLSIYPPFGATAAPDGGGLLVCGVFLATSAAPARAA